MSANSDFLKKRKTPPKSGELKTGQWYSGFTRVYNYAKANGIPLVAMWTRDERCGQCTVTKQAFLKSEFISYMKTCGFLFWFGYETDTSADDKIFGKGYEWVHCNPEKQTYYPTMRFWWYDPSTKKVKVSVGDRGMNVVKIDGKKNATYAINYFKKVFAGYVKPVTFSVVFKNHDGAVLKQAQTVVKNKDAVPPADPVRDGYKFTGWSPDYKNITANTTCVAQYESVASQNDPDPDPDPVPTPQDFGSVPASAARQRLMNLSGKHIQVSDQVSSWQIIGDGDGNGLQDGLIAIQIGKNCERIEPSCFIGCENIVSVYLPEKCRYIGDYAFSGCRNLKYITCLSKNTYTMNYIGNHAFDGCDSLSSICVSLSSGYYNVGLGEGCFANCGSLTSYQQYNSSYLASNMFAGCSSLTRIDVPQNTNYMFPSALANIPNLREITIPNNIWMLHEYAFANDSNLTSVTIVDGDGGRSVLQSVKKGVFSGCDSLTSITLPRSINRLSCIDDGFLLGSSIKKVFFNGLSDDVFANKDTKEVNLGTYKTGKVYYYYNDVQKIFSLSRKYHIPVICMMTNTCVDDPNSPDAGYVLNKNGNFAEKGVCGFCNIWHETTDSNSQWKNFVKKSGYFFVKGGYGPWGHCRYDARVKWLNKSHTEYVLKETYHNFDAAKCSSLIMSSMKVNDVGYFFLGCYWPKSDGNTLIYYKSGFQQVGGKTNVQAKIDKIKSWLKGYKGPDNFSAEYKINEKLTTFGLDSSCVFVSASGKEYTCSNTAYVEYVPPVRVDEDETENFEYGTWYYNAKELRQFADDNNIPALIEYSSVGCPPCIYFRDTVFNNSDFQAWVKSRPYLFCRVETGENENFDEERSNPQAYYLANVWAAESPNYKTQGIPVFMWYWKKAGEQQASVWDLSSYHYAPSPSGPNPPWSMADLMWMTDGKFSGYLSADSFKRRDVSALYSTSDVYVGQIYENVSELSADMTGKYFKCTYRKNMNDEAVQKTINIKGYSGPFPTSIRKGQEVQFNAATYQYYTSPSNAQYKDSSFIIFRVDKAGGKKTVSYLLSGYNEYDTGGQQAAEYNFAEWYTLSADGDADQLEEMIADSEALDIPIAIACLDSSAASGSALQKLTSDVFKDFIFERQIYLVQVKPNSWSSGLGLKMKQFASNSRYSKTAYDTPGFSAWNENAVPQLYLYLGCKTCVLWGQPASVEKAANFSITPETTAQNIIDTIKAKLYAKQS